MTKYKVDAYYNSKAWRELRSRVLQRDGGICFYCGGVARQADHVLPRRKGGKDELTNLVACCVACNKIALATVFKSLDAKKAYIVAARGIINPIPLAPRTPVRDKASGLPRPGKKSAFRQKLADRMRDR